MFSMMRRRFTFAGLIATVALVFAMSGGAWAAKYLITSTKQISPSVLKKLKGKTGATGPAGAAGAVGPAGAAGPKGDTGAIGPKGDTGATGPKGASVTSGEFPGGAEPEEEPCKERGGSEFEVEGSGEQTYACNGEEGSPWTAGGVLPKGATETGAWSIATEGFGGFVFGDISFPIKLAAALPAEKVHSIKAGDPAPSACDNGEGEAPSVENPEADPGHLCLFTALLLEANEEKPPTISKPTAAEIGAGRAGALLTFEPVAEGATVLGSGTFAVTGGP